MQHNSVQNAKSMLIWQSLDLDLTRHDIKNNIKDNLLGLKVHECEQIS